MNGIEKITQRIDADAQAEIDQILAAARAEAADIQQRYQAQAEAEAADLSARSKRVAAEREERLVSVAQMEARKISLAAKQEMLQKAFALALEKLCAMPEEEYISVCAELLIQAAPRGQGKVIFSPAERERVGAAVVAKANALLAKETAPELLKELTDSKMGSLLNKVVAGVAALAQGTAMLTLSPETRPIKGGFVLSDGSVEVNCTFDTLVRLQKAETAGAVAKRLFP